MNINGIGLCVSRTIGDSDSSADGSDPSVCQPTGRLSADGRPVGRSTIGLKVSAPLVDLTHWWIFFSDFFLVDQLFSVKSVLK